MSPLTVRTNVARTRTENLSLAQDSAGACTADICDQIQPPATYAGRAASSGRRLWRRLIHLSGGAE